MLYAIQQQNDRELIYCIEFVPNHRGIIGKITRQSILYLFKSEDESEIDEAGDRLFVLSPRKPKIDEEKSKSDKKKFHRVIKESSEIKGKLAIIFRVMAKNVWILLLKEKGKLKISITLNADYATKLTDYVDNEIMANNSNGDAFKILVKPDKFFDSDDKNWKFSLADDTITSSIMYSPLMYSPQ